jgi:hypothetical protein
MRSMALVALSFLVALSAALVAPRTLVAQESAEWRPPTTEMPQMPTMASLQGEWRSQLSAWFRGVDRVAGVDARTLRASGSPRAGSTRAALVRFMAGPVPAVVWTDRNGDDRADMIEIFRGGTAVIQLIDADYSGVANVLRVYDAAGGLVREERL